MASLPLFLVLASLLLYATTLPHLSDGNFETQLPLETLEAVLQEVLESNCTLSVLHGASSLDHTQVKDLFERRGQRGAVVLEAAANVRDVNGTHQGFRGTVAHVTRMGQLWHCLALVVVSDDPTFLAAFAHLSLRWSTRILILTRLPLSKLGGLHGLLSSRNAMLLIAKGNKSMSGDLYSMVPFAAPDTRPKKVASWNRRKGLFLSSDITLFPDKFKKFAHRPSLVVVFVAMPNHRLKWVEDSSVPGGRRLLVSGAFDETTRYFAEALNFTFRYVLSSERDIGIKLANGCWTGMIGTLAREEADFCAVPAALSPMRAEAVDYTSTIWTSNIMLFGGLKEPKVDPWGFLLPLEPLVWAATLAALLGVIAVLELLPFCLIDRTLGRSGWPPNAFSCVRIILQQDVVLSRELWWWERLVLGVWTLTTLVLLKSYGGNLMSLLAVRYIPQPFQTPRDILNDRHVVMIWQKSSQPEEFLKGAPSGVFLELARLETKGRLLFHALGEFSKSLDTLVRNKDYVLIGTDAVIKTLVVADYSATGRCDFYMSRNGFFTIFTAIFGQKRNPLVQSLDKW